MESSLLKSDMIKFIKKSKYNEDLRINKQKLEGSLVDKINHKLMKKERLKMCETDSIDQKPQQSVKQRIQIRLSIQQNGKISSEICKTTIIKINKIYHQVQAKEIRAKCHQINYNDQYNQNEPKQLHNYLNMIKRIRKHFTQIKTEGQQNKKLNQLFQMFHSKQNMKNNHMIKTFWYNRGIKYIKDNFVTVLRCFKEALIANPLESKAIQLVARIYEKIGKNMTAKSGFSSFIIFRYKSNQICYTLCLYKTESSKILWQFLDLIIFNDNSKDRSLLVYFKGIKVQKEFLIQKKLQKIKNLLKNPQELQIIVFIFILCWPYYLDKKIIVYELMEQQHLKKKYSFIQ
ncbi:unnamed protein product [Paramecium sonneborni]|uniref:Uncharacterized protein n=1 Tax=Paramecium sonneborni TaxID=65129 RepID=A0A8S1MMU9_9CILI|nr:unnamed protein product [Paramecium sonneborni]